MASKKAEAGIALTSDTGFELQCFGACNSKDGTSITQNQEIWLSRRYHVSAERARLIAALCFGEVRQ